MDYDVVIVGSGSAGLPAGMYASRYKLKNVVIEITSKFVILASGNTYRKL